MTAHTDATLDAENVEIAVEKPKRKKRIFLWVFLAVQILFLVWIIGGAGSADLPDCTGLKGNKLNNCEVESAGGAIGTGIGVMLIVGLWCVTDFLLGVGYAIYRLAKRP